MGLSSFIFGPKGCFGLVPWYSDRTVITHIKDPPDNPDELNFHNDFDVTSHFLSHIPLLSYFAKNEDIQFRPYRIFSRTLSRGWFNGSCDMDILTKRFDGFPFHPCPLYDASEPLKSTSYSWRKEECQAYDMTCHDLDSTYNFTFFVSLVGVIFATLTSILLVYRIFHPSRSKLTWLYYFMALSAIGLFITSVIYFRIRLPRATWRAFKNSQITGCDADGPCYSFFVDTWYFFFDKNMSQYTKSTYAIPVGWILASVGLVIFSLGYLFIVVSSCVNTKKQHYYGSLNGETYIALQVDQPTSRSYSFNPIHQYSRTTHNSGYSLRNHTDQQGINYVG